MAGRAIRLTDAVLLTGDRIELAYRAVLAAQHYRRLNGNPASVDLEELRKVLGSAIGPTDEPERTPEHAEDQVSGVAMVTPEQAAVLLGCTARHARRLAPKVGGRRQGGRWLIDRQALQEHIEGRR